jgi:hypothetical protein
MNFISFTPAEMEEVGDVLRKAFLAVFDNLDPIYQDEIREFWRTHLKVSRPVTMVTETGLVDYKRSVFGHDLKRDFVIRLTSTFFFMWGASNDTRLGLMRSLANSISVDLGLHLTKVPEYRGIPKETADRMKESTETLEVLTANTWLAVMIMATMYMSYRDFEEKPAPTARRRPQGNAA